MAPKKNAAAAAPADTPVSTPAKATKAAKAQSSSKSPLAPEQIWSHYWKTTGHQTRLIDAFLAFLMVVGAIQFVYYFLIAKDVRANTPPAPKPTLREERLKRASHIAFQRLPGRFRRHRWPIRPYWYVSAF